MSKKPPSSLLPNRGRGTALLVSLAIAGLPLSVSAQTSPPAPASAPVPATLDLVRSKDGAEFNGVISEKVPGSHVVIVTVAGSNYRIEWANVTYAGPRAEAPSTAQPPATSAPPSPVAPLPSDAVAAAPSAAALGANQTRLSLTSTPSGAMWLSGALGEPLQPLCAAPCDTVVDKGPRRFGVDLPGRAPVIEANVWDIQADDRLAAAYTSRRGSRITGGIVIAGGLALAVSSIAYGVLAQELDCSSFGSDTGSSESCEDSLSTAGKAMIGIGVTSALLAAIIGGKLVFKRDEVRLEAGAATRRAATPEEDVPTRPVEIAIALAPTTKSVWACIADARIRSITVRVTTDPGGKVQGVTVPPQVGDEASSCLRKALVGQATNESNQSVQLRFQRDRDAPSML